MPSRAPFLPPRDSPLVRELALRLLGPMFSWHAGGIQVETREEDLATLRALKKQRVLILPNHPTHFDPMVMLELGRRLEEEFYFVAAREVFDQNFGLRGWLFQRLGVYSLIRGAVDRESLTLTQKTLADGGHWLVIFPEGESTLENDRIIPFEPGVASLALRVQEKLNDQAGGPDGAPPLHVVTIAMRTRYKPGVETAIAASLNRLEQAVGLPCGGPFAGWPAARVRIQHVGDHMLTLVEKSCMPTMHRGKPIDARITAIKDHLLAKMESFLHLKSVPTAPVLERVQAIKNAMDRSVHAYGELAADMPPYEQRLLELRRKTFAGFYADVRRIINFLTLRGDYLDRATPERFAEVIIRLEQEILGHPVLKHPRIVTVRIGAVRDARTHSAAFAADRRKTAVALTAEWEQEMNALLAT